MSFISPAGWQVSYIAIAPVYGQLIESSSGWKYKLTSAGSDNDNFTLALRNTKTQQSGVMNFTVRINADTPIVSVPEILTVNDVGTQGIVFNAGVTRPAELTFTIDGIDGSFRAGEIVRTDDAIIEVIPDTMEINGPGAGGGLYSASTHIDYQNLMFIACDMGGCYRSTDGGESWVIFNNDIISLHHKGPGAKIFPDGKTVVWPGNGVENGTDKILVSYDTGVTWLRAGVLPTRSLNITDPSNAVSYNAPICAAHFDGKCLIGTKLDGLTLFDPADYSFTSIDTDIETNIYGDPRGVWFLEVEDNHGYYVTGKDLRKFVYKDGVFTTNTITTATNYIVGFGYSNGKFLLTVKDDGVYLSENDAVSWVKVDDFKWQIWLHVTPTGAMYAAPVHGGHFYTPDVFSLTSIDRAGKPIWKSIDNGVTWVDVFNINKGGNVERSWIQTRLSWSYYFMLNGFIVIPGATSAEDILWATTQGEVFKSVDGAGTWTAPYRKKIGILEGLDRSQSIGLEVTSCWGLVENLTNPDVWHGLWTDIGGQFSPDKGQSWVAASTGVPANNQNTLYGVAIDPDVPGRVWGAWAQTHDIPWDGYVAGVAGNGGIYTSMDYGLTWGLQYIKGVTGPASQNCTDVVYDPYSGALYAAVYGQKYYEDVTASFDNGGVWKSVDKGETWERKVNGLDYHNLGNHHVYRMAVGANGTIYALVTRYQSPGGPGGLYKTLDGGDSWELIGPTGPAGSNWARWPTAFTFGATENDIYITAVDNQTTTVGLMATHDGGATWKSLWSKYDHGGRYDYMMSIYVEGDFMILGGTRTGPWLSWDHGKTWEVWRDFPYHNIQSFTKLRDGRLACTTFGAGIFITDVPPRGGANLQSSRGTLKVTRLTDIPRELRLNFILTDNTGQVTTAATQLKLEGL